MLTTNTQPLDRKYWFCSICSIMWIISTNWPVLLCLIHTDIWHPVGVALVVWWEQAGSLCPHTCAELRAFHLFPSLAPDLPPTMGSWPRRLTPARTSALPDTAAAHMYECINARFAHTHVHIVRFDPLSACHCDTLAFIKHTDHGS